MDSIYITNFNILFNNTMFRYQNFKNKNRLEIQHFYVKRKSCSNNIVDIFNVEC